MDKKVEEKIEKVKEKANKFKDNYFTQVKNIFEYGTHKTCIAVGALGGWLIGDFFSTMMTSSFGGIVINLLLSMAIFWIISSTIGDLVTKVKDNEQV